MLEIQVRERDRKLAHVLRIAIVNELAAGLAHEVSQPLNSVANYLEACLGHARSQNDPVLVGLLERAARDAERAAKIVRHLGRFMRKREPELEAADLREILADVVDLIAPSLPRARTTMRFDPGSRALPVRVDRIRIEQAIMNLLQNAMEANVRRRADTVLEVCATRGRVKAEVSIVDEGIGVRSPVEKLFEPFTSTKRGGLGLGLSICRSIVQDHGGAVSLCVRTDGKSGTVARLTLPLIGASPAPSPARRRPARSRS